jgi:flagellum-specific peptidoglycan hydrolase FlgJ
MLNIQSIRLVSFEKWRKKTLIFILLLASQLVFAQSKYIKQYKPLADSLSKEYKIPVSVILGVAIIESGAGTSRNSKLLHNHFGIVGKNDLLKTKGIKSRYKQFKSAADSYQAFCKLLKKRKYYDKLKGNMNYHLWLDAMSKHGYSEEPEQWKQRITAAIRKSKLSGTF